MVGRLLDAPFALVARLRRVAPDDHEFFRAVSERGLSSGDLRTDAALGRALVSSLDHGVTVRGILGQLPMNDEWVASEQQEFLRLAVQTYSPSLLDAVEAQLREQ